MKKLFDKANLALTARSEWDAKQRLYFEMRHEGLRRRNKPWPGAADLHFPLVDMNIRKAKPFWEAQATAGDRLASFVAMTPQQDDATSAAADYFDFELRQNTNFEIEFRRCIDTMLLRGRGVIKCVTDPFEDHKICFESVDPTFIIIADGADDFEDADWFVEVQHFSVAAYRRNRLFNQDDKVIAAIRGSRDSDRAGDLLQDKEMREGVNCSRNPDQIILWNHYEKTMGGWTRYTYSPQSPDEMVRKPAGVPYKAGNKVSIPFFSFKTEVKDRGWYSPRGVAELNAPFEAYSCKLWNEKTDAMTFGNRPVFTSDQPLANTTNIRWNPGEFIPGNIKPVPGLAPAFSFDQEIAFARATSEQVSMLPDFGIVQPGSPSETGGKPRTATENNRIANLQSVGTESNGNLFRLDLAKLYRHAWGLIVQFKRERMVYFVAGSLNELPDEALHDSYLIRPDGSSDQWNKQLRQQRADARLQKFRGAPNVDQDGLVRDSLAADDPGVAQKLFIPTNIKAGSEAEDEAMEIVIMQDGFPAQVKSDEDHATRIHVLLSWLQKQAMTGAPVDPVARQRVQQHLAVHFQFLQKLDPQAAAQVRAQIAQMERAPV